MLEKPLLDDNAAWKQRFRAPTVMWTQQARHAPHRGLACSNRSGNYQLYAWDVESGDLRQLTHKEEGIIFGYLSPDGTSVYFLLDEHGEETGHYVRVPWDGGSAVDITPDLPRYSSWTFEQAGSGSTIGFSAAIDNAFHVYTMPVDGNGRHGSPQEIFHSTAIAAGPVLSHDGEVGIIATTERSGKLQYSLVAMDVQAAQTIGTLWDGPESSVEPFAFSPLPGDFRLLATTDRSGVPRPLLWNPRTGERHDLELDGIEGEVAPVDWAPDGQRVLLCQFDRAVQHLLIYDLRTNQVTRLEHPGGSLSLGADGGTYFASDSEIFAQLQDSTRPSRLIALDASTGEERRTVLSAGDAPVGRKWRSVSFLSSDGVEIQAWLATPDGEGPFPTVLHTHGGPEAVQTETFSPGAQMWLDHGFGFLSVNYRGSTTFGRDFKEKIWYHPGVWEVEDMAAGYQWLVEQGIAQADAVLVTGRSYGGYNTLQALGTKPDLWAGGMAGVAVADWFSQYEDESDAMRGVDVPFFGGTPEEKPEAYAAASPITYADAVRAPVVIIQGRNDTRCPARQVELYAARLTELGKEVEVHWYDAGHFAPSVEQAVAHDEIFLRFAYRVLRPALVGSRS